jgi:hypothetical protein
MSGMFETTPPQPVPDSPADLADPTELADLADPVAGVTGVELSRRFTRLALSWLEPMVSDLADDEALLRRTGGTELAAQIIAQKFYRRLDPQVFLLVRRSVPLAAAAAVLDCVEDLLRARFTEVVDTAAGYLLSHDRDVAIQMAATAITMAAREVRAAAAQIIVDANAAETAEVTEP